MAKGNPTAGILLMLLGAFVISAGYPAISNLFGGDVKGGIINNWLKDNGLDEDTEQSNKTDMSGGSKEDVPGTQLPPGTKFDKNNLLMGFVGERGASHVGLG